MLWSKPQDAGGVTHSHVSVYTRMLGHPQSVDLLIIQAPGQPGITLGFSVN